jgi:hypothetical protein
MTHRGGNAANASKAGSAAMFAANAKRPIGWLKWDAQAATLNE